MARGPIRRFGWLVCGVVCVGIGAIGVVVPGLPTTVFFIAAAASFARSSRRLEAWLLSLPKVGPAVRDYRAGLGMPVRAKVVAISMIVVMVTISAVLIGPSVVSAVVIVAGAIGVGVILRIPTRRA